MSSPQYHTWTILSIQHSAFRHQPLSLNYDRVKAMGFSKIQHIHVIKYLAKATQFLNSSVPKYLYD